MGMISKNGQIHPIPTKKGKQKGLVTKNGQISTLIPYLPADVVVAPTADPTIANVMGVALASIANVTGVASANISNVLGVDKE
tara:strand:- start:1253 stop:1501 length:249 start_codon:yes stop_codon:yes gene_type:complete